MSRTSQGWRVAHNGLDTDAAFSTNGIWWQTTTITIGLMQHPRSANIFEKYPCTYLVRPRFACAKVGGRLPSASLMPTVARNVHVAELDGGGFEGYTHLYVCKG